MMRSTSSANLATAVVGWFALMEVEHLRPLLQPAFDAVVRTLSLPMPSSPGALLDASQSR